MAEVTSSNLVGPTILFRHLDDFLRLLVIHLCHSCASEEKLWRPSLVEIKDGLFIEFIEEEKLDILREGKSEAKKFSDESKEKSNVSIKVLKKGGEFLELGF